MDTDTKTLQKPAVYPEGKCKAPPDIRVYPCESVVKTASPDSNCEI